MRRVTSGVPGFDDVLGGGIPEGSSFIIAGSPGTGKTILAQHLAFTTNLQRPALYVATMAEPQLKILRYQQQFGYFDPSKFMSSVVFEDVSTSMYEDSESVVRALDAAMVRNEPGLVVIDSFKAIADLTRSALERRAFIYGLSLRMAVWGCTLVLVGEYTEEDIYVQPEFAVVDGILYLSGTEEHKVQRRHLRVMKMRGTSTLPGEHALTISEAGVGVHPRRAPVAAAQTYADMAPHRQPTGVPGLDEMMSGGVPEGSTTMIVGPSGSGKSLIALSWLVHGARAGEPGILLSYDSPPQSILRQTSQFGWDVTGLIEQGLLQIVHVSPIEVSLETDLEQLTRLVEERGVRRTVVDSISSLGMRDRTAYTDYVWGLTDWFKINGCSILMVAERSYSVEVLPNDDTGFSYLADNMLTIEYHCEGPRLDRSIRVLKMRAGSHDQSRRLLVITQEGPRVMFAQTEAQ